MYVPEITFGIKVQSCLRLSLFVVNVLKACALHPLSYTQCLSWAMLAKGGRGPHPNNRNVWRHRNVQTPARKNAIPAPKKILMSSIEHEFLSFSAALCTIEVW